MAQRDETAQRGTTGVRARRVLPALLSAALVGCGAPTEEVDPVGHTVAPTDGRIVGIVTDVAGMPLPGVTVSLPDGPQARTDASGSYALSGVAPGDDLVLSFRADGYNTAYNDVDLPAYQTQTANASLHPVHHSYVFDSQEGGTFQDDSTSLSFQPNSIVDSAGMPYDGEVQLDLSVIEVNSDDADQIGPGDFRGLRDGQESLLVSYGFFEATLWSPTGERLNLAPGMPATMEMAVPDKLGPGAEQNLETGAIPMWWFDEDSAIWVEEGEAAVVETEEGEVFVAEIPHFTWWNVDWWYEDVLVCVKGQIVDEAGNPVPSAEITLSGIDPWLDAPYTVSSVADEYGFFEIGEAYELSEVLITVSAVVDGVDWATTITYETGESISQWGDVCEEMDDPIALPACVIGGDAFLVDRITPGEGSVVVNEEELFLDALVDASSGEAQFFDAVGLETCTPAWQEVPTGSCEYLESIDNLPWELEYFGDRQDAGSAVRMVHSDYTLFYPSEEGANGPIYRADIGEQDLTHAAHRLVVPGSNDVPGFSQDSALRLPAEVLISSPDPLQKMSIPRSSDFTMEFEASDYNGGVYLVIEDASAGGLVCHSEDDGSLTVSAYDLVQLEGGDATIHLLRQNTRYHNMPTGYPLRAVGASAYTGEALIE